MACPKYNAFFKPVLLSLQDGKVHELEASRAFSKAFFHLTDADTQEMLESGASTLFRDRHGWACTYLKKAGLIVSPKRKQFRVTEEGKKVLANMPQELDLAFLKQYPSFMEFWSPKPKQGANTEKTEKAAVANKLTLPDEINPVTPDVALDEAYQQIRAAVIDELLEEVRKLSPVAFERMVLDLMAKMGYGTFANAARMTATTGDEGIDGIIMEDKLGFDLIYVQVKHWKEGSTVGRPEVQAFVGAIAGRDGKGLFVTTSTFSQHAIEYAAKQHIILIDGEKLANLMLEHDFGVTTKRTYAIKSVEPTLFEDYADN